MGIRWTGYIFLENLERALRILKKWSIYVGLYNSNLICRTEKLRRVVA